MTFLHGAGEMDIVSVSLFNGCDTDIKSLKVSRSKQGFNISIYCDTCKKYTSFIFSLKELSKKGGHYLLCNSCGIDLGFLGAKDDVESVANEHRKELEHAIKEMGLDNFFKNPMIVYELINHLHNLAEGNNISCECGSNEINAELTFDKVELFCKKCKKSIFIDAKDRCDLEKVKKVKSILITDEKPWDGKISKC